LITSRGKKLIGKSNHDGIDACEKGIICSRKSRLTAIGFNGTSYDLGEHCFDDFYATPRGPVIVYSNRFSLVALKEWGA
jgi:hypothetical protein